MSSETFDPVLPVPYATDWRKAYRYEKTDLPRLSSYQAPGGSPVAFISGTMDLSGGHSGQTSSIAYYGFWTNSLLNEKPHGITVSGFIRGDDYIKNRNALVKALRVKTDDDSCGYLDLPTWGRFPVVVFDYHIGEDAQKLGQCTLSITFTRAGLSDKHRMEAAEAAENVCSVTKASGLLQNAAVASFVSTLSIVSNLDTDCLAASFGQLKTVLLAVSGCVQGSTAYLNKMADAVSQISHLTAQGIRSPAQLALALFAAVSTIAAAVAEITSAADSYDTLFSGEDTDASGTADDGHIRRNTEKVLHHFLTADSFSVTADAVTEAQQKTKAASENLYRLSAYMGAAVLLPEMDATYDRQLKMWKLFQRLQDSIDQEDSDVYAALETLRIAAAAGMAARNAGEELAVTVRTPVPLLPLARRLGCSEAVLRELNSIPDSFTIQGEIKYV